MKQVIFVVPPLVQLLDLAGPVQAFYAAITLGADYQLRYVGFAKDCTSAQQLAITQLQPYQAIKAGEGDLIIIAGVSSSRLAPEALNNLGDSFFNWLRENYENGAKICSVCNATFLLARSGLLDGRKCTTHWSRLNQLQAQFPKLDVLGNRLFIKDGNLYSSAGICSGIDLALAIIEEDMGAFFTSKVAQSLVIYIRRDGHQAQTSVYLDHRSHMNPQIHKVQDTLAQNPQRDHTIASLAEVAFMSPRHLTRCFKKETGLTINHYLTLLRMERAEAFMRNPEMSIEDIALKCGFRDGRQFRRQWRRFKGCAPSEFRASTKEHSFPLPRTARRF